LTQRTLVGVLVHGVQRSALLQLKRRAQVVKAPLAASPQDEVKRGFPLRGRACRRCCNGSDVQQRIPYRMLIDDLRIVARDRPIRVVVIDNQSSDGTVELIRSHSDIKLVESGGNLGRCDKRRTVTLLGDATPARF
jgi:hypothetical protein